jgi:hypothetical protein
VTPLEDTRHLPNLVIIGVAKAATTSLFRYLAQHPDVFPAAKKELRYFTSLRYGEPLPPLEDYARHFARSGSAQYRMEATPGYFAGGRPVAEAVDGLLPDARVIVSFRDPVQRCWSWFQFVRSTARIPKEMTFAEYVDRCWRLHDEGTDGHRVNQPFWGLGGGCYDLWLEPWLEIFGDRFRIEFFEDVVRDAPGVVKELCDWLEIDRAVCGGFAYGVENRTVQYKNKPLQKAALSVNRNSEAFFAAHPTVKRALRSAYYRINSDKNRDRMDPSVRERLVGFYTPHNERLAAQLTAADRMDCPDWLRAYRRV